MTAEVLVLCAHCGRPQRAALGRCGACGNALPEAPLPAGLEVSPGRFLLAEFAGGRLLVGEAGHLSFRTGPTATPLLLELSSLRRLALVSRPRYEALALGVLALVTLLAVPGLVGRLLAAGLLLTTGGLTLAWRRYTLVLESSGGVETRWELGMPRRGSALERRVWSSWHTLVNVGQALGVRVETPASDPGTPAA